MKRIIMLVLALLLMFSVPVYAGQNGNNNNSGDTYNNTYNTTNSGGQGGQGGNATAYGGDAKAYGGNALAGANANANAKIEKGAVQVDNKNTNLNANINANSNKNENVNKNKNINKNTNKQAQGQGQIQGQMQGQLQGQAQSNTNKDVGNINAPMSQTMINEDKRELPNIVTGTAPNLFAYRGDFKGTFDKLRPWELKATWTKEYIDTFPYCNIMCGGTVELAGLPNPTKCKSGDDCIPAFDVVKQSKLKNVMVVTIERDNPLVLWGTVSRLALDNGIKEVVPYGYAVTFSNTASGWNIGLGGGVSVLNGGSNDNYGGSVGGGIGFGSVETKPVEKVKGIFLMYW